MSEEKERQSGEQERKDPGEPVLPTVNPAAVINEKTEPVKPSLHPAFYIAYATLNTRPRRDQC
jgi:hypothetical protein